MSNTSPPANNVMQTLFSCRPVYSILERNKKVTKFLNRMLAMSLRDQKMLFAYFSDTLVSRATDTHAACNLSLACWVHDTDSALAGVSRHVQCFLTMLPSNIDCVLLPQGRGVSWLRQAQTST